jgi:uncharacterized protein (TIGR02147 family)
MKPVFSYIDYRKYLADYYQEQKSETRFFSYRYFAKKAGINSPNFLKQIIESRRSLTNQTIPKFVAALKLSEKESRYFKHLVWFNQAMTAEEKQEHYAVILSMMHTVKEQRLTADQHEYYNNWYVSVIRELVCLRDFKDNYKRMASTVSPPIGAREARFSVLLLRRLGMIRKRQDGTYYQTSTAIISNSEVDRMAVRSFNREMLRKAEKSLDEIPREERQIFGVTIGISRACYDVLTAEMIAFRDRVVAITNSDRNGSRVYQMHLQLFPLSRDTDAGRTRETEE